jgi:hypothetical protein
MKPWGETSGPVVLTISRDGEIEEFNQQDIDILSQSGAFELYGTAFHFPQRKMVSHYEIIGDINGAPGAITYYWPAQMRAARIGERLRPEGRNWFDTLFAPPAAKQAKAEREQALHRAIRKV